PEPTPSSTSAPGSAPRSPRASAGTWSATPPGRARSTRRPGARWSWLRPSLLAGLHLGRDHRLLVESHRLGNAGGDRRAVGAGATGLGHLAEQPVDARPLVGQSHTQRPVDRRGVHLAAHPHPYLVLALLEHLDTE